MNLGWRTGAAVCLGAALFFVAWGAAMLALTLFQPAGRPVAVFAGGGAAAALRAVVAADGYILQVRGDAVIAVADDSGFVPRLYRAGAIVVIEASAAGCIVSPTAPARALPPTSPAV
jgi:hypothetical protein